MPSGDNNVTQRVGIAVIGVGGAVATTVAAGIELLRLGLTSTDGLPLAHVDEQLVPYANMTVAGWDVCPDDLATAIETHGVLGPTELAAAGTALSDMRPWPAIGDRSFCRNVSGDHRIACDSLRAAVTAIRADLSRYREEQQLDGLVMVNLASTERPTDVLAGPLASLDALETGLDANDAGIGPAALYAYAALREGSVGFAAAGSEYLLEAPAGGLGQGS
jgi:myo-inositol-1-phosphate synthase